MDWFDDVLLELEEIDRVYFDRFKQLKKELKGNDLNFRDLEKIDRSYFDKSKLVKKELKNTEFDVKVPRNDQVNVNKKVNLNNEKKKMNFNVDFLKVFSSSTPLAKVIKVFVIFIILFLSMIGIFLVLIMFLKA